jgi:hypothetical protein
VSYTFPQVLQREVCMKSGAGGMDDEPHQMQEGYTSMKSRIMRKPFWKTVKLWSTVHGRSFVKSGRIS